MGKLKGLLMFEMFEKINNLICNHSQLAEREKETLFDKLALGLFNYQFEKNLIYRSLCEAQGKNPNNINNWTQIPLLSTNCFKEYKLFCQPENLITKTFVSSGTTQSQKSQHYLSQAELTLYENSLIENFFEAFKLNEKSIIKYFVLTESPVEKPNSSLIYMFETIRKKLKLNSNIYFIQNDQLQISALNEALNNACLNQIPILLAGTAFSFVNLLDSNISNFKFPANSALMETGGFKGKSREISKPELYKALSEKFNLPNYALVGQYGMSELNTQYYDSSFILKNEHEKNRYKKAPPWAKNLILNINNLKQEVQIGETGLIAHYDLANLDSLAFVLTGDLAIKKEDNYFELIGRASNLALKGCSLNYENSDNKY